ncbi:MAG: ABC transporter permease subunit [Planctomycetota bacterium]
MTQPGQPSQAVAESKLSRGASRRARIIDRFAEVIITSGGLAVLAAMLGICLFLFNSAAPLLTGGVIDTPTSESSGATTQKPVAIIPEAGDGHVMVLDDRARVATIDFKAGTPSTLRALAQTGGSENANEIASISYDPSGYAVIGLTDGRLATRRFGYERFPAPVDSEAFGDGFDARTLERELRLQEGSISDDAYARTTESGERVVWDLRLGSLETLEVALGEPIDMVHAHSVGGRQWPFVAVVGEGEAIVGRVRSVRRLDGDGERRSVRTQRVSLELFDDAGLEGVYVVGEGSSILARWSDGTIQHYTNATGAWALSESTGLGGSRMPTAAAMALGGRSLLVGDDAGALHRLMIAPPLEETGSPKLVIANTTPVGSAPVTSIGVQGQGRTVAVTLADGTVAIVAPTSGDVIATTSVEDLDGSSESGDSPAVVGLAGDLRTLAIVSELGSITTFDVVAGHPDAGPRGLFGRVWYEGYAEPRFVYQSTGAPGAEPKFGLVPLIFGTLKATLAAMLIAVPLGVAGAVYTSEFLHPNLRRVVKPTIELMASLPSVVLGFVAAVLIAPLARDTLPVLLLGCAVVPVVVVLAAQVARFAPDGLRRRTTTLAHLGAVTLVVGGGVGLASVLAPSIESAAFTPSENDRLVMAGVYEPVSIADLPEQLRGVDPVDANPAEVTRLGLFVREGKFVAIPELPDDLRAEMLAPTEGLGGLRRWLDGEFGNAWPGWMMLMIPVGAFIVLIADGRADRLWAAIGGDAGPKAAGIEVARLAVRVVATLGSAAALASLLTEAGLDPRDSLFGAFSQRNTIVVGIAMGFAVIPIIYTISEDAMSSVPRNLRAASLGSGATPWQTAARVVLPVAGSGIFSACMVGLGRAVGETMIVLMATGNTPEISANIFSGFRTLAANIAVELPEAPRGGTHYRVLFLCGLLLFMMTLVINTTAELVRQHVRKRNAGL